MTEELEKEAEEYAIKSYGNDAFTQVNMPQMIEPVRLYLKQGYFDGAEPREKQIQIDAEQIRALQKQNGELTDELKALRESTKDYGAGCYENGLRNGKRAVEKDIEKLEAQIDKMKCCGNCNHHRYTYGELECMTRGCKNKRKWELAE